jgi:AraC-like DNA-binding protein
MPERLLGLLDRPAMSGALSVRPGGLTARLRKGANVDVLSEVLRAVRLTGAIYFDVSARAPWVAATPSMSAVCTKVMPEAEHVIAFHIMLEGECWAQIADGSEPPAHLESGDAILFPQGDNHSMSTEKGVHGEPDLSLYNRPRDQALPFTLSEFGGAGAPARFVCGYLGCDRRPYNPLLDALPRTLHVRCPKEGANLTCDLIRVALAEKLAPRAGGETILAKLSELMFVQAVRQHIDDLPEGRSGWLSGLRDRHVGAALRLMHGQPADAWTLDALAREVGLSRSAFAERFAHYVDESPMKYLGRWRMQLAARALERPGVSIAQAAAEVGYQSEAAFNRAFKKFVGAPPGEWRRSHLAGAGAHAEA